MSLILKLGVTRQPTLSPTIRPTFRPTGPTISPSAVPTMAPTPDSLCCASSSYYRSTWQSCSAASDPSDDEITSCKDCYAYQCIDWTVGSAGMQARETNFFNATGNLGLTTPKIFNYLKSFHSEIDIPRTKGPFCSWIIWQ
jgi:hypothetical protein